MSNNLIIRDNIVVGFYDEFIENIVIPEGVTEIANNAFKKYYGLKTIILPTTLQIIGDEAFYKCSSLEEIILTENVSFIGKQAFKECSLLKRADFSLSNIMELPYECFAHCCKLKEISLPDSIIKICDRCFFKCKNLPSLFFNEGLKVVEDVFCGCDSLKSLYIPNSLIHMESLRYIKNLKQIQISSKQKERFIDCFPLDVKFETIELVNGVLFNVDDYPDLVIEFGETGGLGITLPDGTIVIKNMQIVKVIEYLGDGKNIVIPEGITWIERNVFENLEINSIQIPKSLYHIEAPNFIGCTAKSFNCMLNERYSLLNGCLIEDNKTIIASLGNGIPTQENITNIGVMAFGDTLDSLLTIPQNIKIIAENAFFSYTLEEVCIKHPIEYISQNAFYSDELKRIIISTQCKNVEDGAFEVPNGNSLDVFLIGENTPDWLETFINFDKKTTIAGNHDIWKESQWRYLPYSSFKCIPVAKERLIHIGDYYEIYLSGCGINIEYGDPIEVLNVSLVFVNKRRIFDFEVINELDAKINNKATKVELISLKIDGREILHRLSSDYDNLIEYSNEGIVTFTIGLDNYNFKNLLFLKHLEFEFAIFDKDEQIIESFNTSMWLDCNTIDVPK